MFHHCEFASACLSCLFRQIGKSVVVLVDIAGQKRMVVVFGPQLSWLTMAPTIVVSRGRPLVFPALCRRCLGLEDLYDRHRDTHTHRSVGVFVCCTGFAVVFSTRFLHFFQSVLVAMTTVCREATDSWAQQEGGTNSKSCLSHVKSCLVAMPPSSIKFDCHYFSETVASESIFP